MIVKKQYGILVPLNRAQVMIQLLKSMELLDDGHQLVRMEDSLLLPLAREMSANEASRITEQAGEFRTQFTAFKENEKPPKDLHEALRAEIPSELMKHIPRSHDVIGDVAIVELPKDLERFALAIGQGIMRINPHIRLVLQKRSEVSGQFRTRKFEVIAGSGGTETIYHEFGCEYHLDVSEVYFNPRLSHERMRIARQVRPGERVVDMFAGVGPYSILIAKLQPHSTLHSIDINPKAVEYLVDNALRNGVAERVLVMSGDVNQFAHRELKGLASRVIMNLPSEAKEHVPAAIKILKPEGGVIHYYGFARREESVQTVRDTLESAVEAQKRKVDSILFCKVIKEVSSSKVQVAIDALVK